MILLEVMDKEATVFEMWRMAAVWGIGGYFACRWSRWLALLFVPVALLAALGGLAELGDRFVGPAILDEAGASYPLHAAVTAALACGLPLAGALAGALASRRKRTDANAAPSTAPSAG